MESGAGASADEALYKCNTNTNTKSTRMETHENITCMTRAKLMTELADQT